jgi:hypothetical protein
MSKSKGKKNQERKKRRKNPSKRKRKKGRKKERKKKIPVLCSVLDHQLGTLGTA